MKNSLKAYLSLLSLVALVGCGQQRGAIEGNHSDGSIIGGQAAKEKTTITSMTAAIVDIRRGASCTASILSNSILLTAAHCVQGGDPANYRVVFGLTVNSSQSVIQPVSGFKFHKKYLENISAEKDLGDIAVVRFSGGLPEGYRPASILLDASAIQTGREVLLAGYGHTEGVTKTGSGTLRYVVVKIEDAEFSPTEVAVNQREGKGACQGDSGGPAYIADANGNIALFGVTSRGFNDPDNTCGVTGVYTNLLAYKQWIVQAANTLIAEAKKKQSSSVSNRVALGF